MLSKNTDLAITKWFEQIRHSGVVVSPLMIMEKAKQFSIQLNEEFDPNSGWLYRWQQRHGITLKKNTWRKCIIQ